MDIKKMFAGFGTVDIESGKVTELEVTQENLNKMRELSDLQAKKRKEYVKYAKAWGRILADKPGYTLEAMTKDKEIIKKYDIQYPSKLKGGQ